MEWWKGWIIQWIFKDVQQDCLCDSQKERSSSKDCTHERLLKRQKEKIIVTELWLYSVCFLEWSDNIAYIYNYPHSEIELWSKS